jgi:hypothetical protein
MTAAMNAGVAATRDTANQSDRRSDVVRVIGTAAASIAAIKGNGEAIEPTFSSNAASDVSRQWFTVPRASRRAAVCAPRTWLAACRRLKPRTIENVVRRLRGIATRLSKASLSDWSLWRVRRSTAIALTRGSPHRDCDSRERPGHRQ